MIGIFMIHLQSRFIFVIAALLAMQGCGDSHDAATAQTKHAEVKAQSEFEALRTRAESGDAQAQLDLALRFESGDGVGASQPKAFEWFLKAAENGNAEGMAHVARAYQDGLGIAKDEGKSSTWTKKAAEAGHAQAQYIYAQTFGSTDRVTYIYGQKDELVEHARQYIEWMEKAAAQKWKKAQYALGMTYLLGATAFLDEKKLVEPDLDKGVALLKEAADAGYWQAQWAMGVLYQAGFGKIKSDKDLSAKYWKQLAAQSDPGTLNNIALLYDQPSKQYYKPGKNKYMGNSLDFEESNKIAFEYFQRAADQGHMYGLYNLGRCYMDGRGVLKDESKALEYFKRAAEVGHYGSMQKVAFAYLNGEGVVRDYAEAYKWLVKAAAENPTSTWSDVHKVRNALGALHEYAWGIDKDIVLAYAWYNIAASGGYDKAKQNLARVEKAIKPEELREAQTLSREWKPGQPMVRSGSQPTSSTGSDGKSATTNTSGKSLKLATVGTGFFVSSTGNVITNNHVVDGCGEIRIPADNTTAKVVVADQANDLALVKLDVVGKPALAFPSADELKQGEEVFAFGFPLDGFLPSAGNITTGIISALAGPGNNSSLIQTTAPVQPGNSGGPLLNKKGKVVGVVVGKANAIKIAKVTGDIPQNINFAIAPRTVKSFLDGNRIEYQKKGDTFSFDKDTVAIADEARKASMKIECWR